MGFLTRVTSEPETEHILLFSGSLSLVQLPQPSCCYCRSVIPHPINTRLSLMGNPFKSCVRKCLGRRMPGSQKGHTTYLSEISCAMASFSFTNCNSSLKWKKNAMKRLMQQRTLSLSYTISEDEIKDLQLSERQVLLISEHRRNLPFSVILYRFWTACWNRGANTFLAQFLFPSSVLQI